MYKNLSNCFLLMLLLGVAPSAYTATIDESIRFITSSSEYVEIRNSDLVLLDLRYATTNNFTGQNLYGNFDHAFLHKEAADKLARAASNLHAVQPDYRLVIFDALRPRSVQYQLWNVVKDTGKQKYVANPKGGSIHNFGFAVDLSIVDGKGKELDMGTPFDDFTDLAQPRLEKKYVSLGKLTQQQLQNRLLLRKVMQDAGFIQLPIEWWHFDALSRVEVKKNYSIVE